ncbi:MAG TPA: carboxypeptidase-like regulatory domain-containing protein, partial [Chryseolinea sp.]|nr:carboxypeptidase-like regulatory domain-containing protein [Chryseolinea sp.]
MKRKLRNALCTIAMSAGFSFIPGLVLSQSALREQPDDSPPISESMERANNVANHERTSSFYNAEVTVSGKVTDNTGQALPGVNILVKGTANGTTTDTEGSYRLVLADGSGTLVFSFIGYVTQEVTVDNRTSIDVSLVPDIISLSEVVVTGYGSQSKRDITGAVSTIDNKQLLSTPSTNVGQALQGKVAGVTVGNDNSPGGGVMVRIRGFGT